MASSQWTDVVSVDVDDLAGSDFTAALGEGRPLHIIGLDTRLQGDWSPRGLQSAVQGCDVTCIDCNADTEKKTELAATTFFEMLSRQHDRAATVYKVKVRAVEYAA